MIWKRKKRQPHEFAFDRYGFVNQHKVAYYICKKCGKEIFLQGWTQQAMVGFQDDIDNS